MKVRVVCYEGYKAEETPRAFLLGERRVEVIRVLDRWRGEDHEYVKLDGSDGARYILRYDRSRDDWEIQMMEPSPPDGKMRRRFLIAPSAQVDQQPRRGHQAAGDSGDERVRGVRPLRQRQFDPRQRPADHQRYRRVRSVGR